LDSYLSERKPGDKMTVTVFRFDKLRELPVVLGENAKTELSFVPVESPSDLQRSLYEGYLGSKL
jgi:predicted metalloprotease with PDZ domain